MQLAGANLFATDLALLEAYQSDFVLEIFEGRSLFEFWLAFKSELANDITTKSTLGTVITLNSLLYKRTT